MATIGTILAILAVVALFVGLWAAIFRKGKRRRGWLTVLGSLMLLVVGAGLTRDGDRQPASGGGEAAMAATAGETVAVGPAQPAPDGGTGAGGGSGRGEAPGLSQQASLGAYCEGLSRYDAAIAEADEMFGIEGTDEKSEWLNQRDAEIYADMEKEIGAPPTEWQPVASAEQWDQRCQALARGWLMVEDGDAKAATADDTRRIEDTLTLAYIATLNEIKRVRPSDDNFTSVTCKSESFGGYRLVGCTLRGGGLLRASFQSKTYLYMVANKDGHAAIVPIESETKDHLNEVAYGDVNGDPVPVGWYVGPLPLQIDWRAAHERLAP